MEKFLENLESYLTALEESEQKKIIKRYQKELEEKIADGMSEIEAIKSLGDMDSIVFDIYTEYHLNKKQMKEKKTRGDSLNNGIRKCANFLSDTCAEVSYYMNHMSSSALETFFEILLKGIVLIIGILFLKFPFLIIENFVQFGLTFLFYPFDDILMMLASFSLTIIYLILCIMLAIYLFIGYKDKKASSTSKSEVEKKEKIKSSEKSKNYAYIFLKSCLYIIFLIPMICITLVLLLLTAFALFLVYKGVSIIGLVVILVGLLFLSIVITAYITDALDNRNRSHVFSIIVAIVSLISGSILFVDNLMNFDYPKTLEKSAFTPVTESTVIEVDKESKITATGNIKFVVDNDIQDNQILAEFTYFDELYDVSIEKEGDWIFVYTVRDNFEVGDAHYLYQNILSDLKNNRIYNYYNLSGVDTVIYGNEKTKDLLHFKE